MPDGVKRTREEIERGQGTGEWERALIASFTTPSGGGLKPEIVANVRNQSSRNGRKPKIIVLHTTEGHNRPGLSDLDSLVSMFDNPEDRGQLAHRQRRRGQRRAPGARRPQGVDAGAVQLDRAQHRADRLRQGLGADEREAAGQHRGVDRALVAQARHPDPALDHPRRVPAQGPRHGRRRARRLRARTTRSTRSSRWRRSWHEPDHRRPGRRPDGALRGVLRRRAPRARGDRGARTSWSCPRRPSRRARRRSCSARSRSCRPTSRR